MWRKTVFVLLDSVVEPAEQWPAMEESFSSRLAGITLPDSDGQQTRLGNLWANRPAVVVFLRHYG